MTAGSRVLHCQQSRVAPEGEAPWYHAGRSLSGSIRKMPQVSATPEVPFRIRHPSAPFLQGDPSVSPPALDRDVTTMHIARGLYGALVISLVALAFHPQWALSAVPNFRPSNADTAFRQVSLSAPSGGHGYVRSAGHTEWPALLDNSSLVRAIGGLDSIFIASTRTKGVSVSLDGAVTYTLPPNTYANRVGTIVTANDFVDPIDGTFPVLTASFTFADGRHWGTGTSSDVMLNAGKALNTIYQVRNWSDQVAPTRPDFVMPPRDPSVFQLYAGPGGVDSVFSDLQTFMIPDTLRNTAVTSVTFSSYSSVDGFPITSTTGLIGGLALWPQFKVTNANADTLARKSQVTNSDHGGYLYGSAPVGTRRRTNVTACQVASLAMCYEFAGFPCSVDSLNAHLQRHQGYDPSVVAIVTEVSPTGDQVDYTPYSLDGTKLIVGDRFLVEQGHYTRPLATYEVTIPGHAERRVLHNATPAVARGDRGFVYWNMRRSVADTYTQNPRLVTHELGASSQLTAQVEALLSQNIPVQLNLATLGHFVVADGRMPSFRPDGKAHGTYSIKDPYDTRNFTRLDQSQIIGSNLADYANRFRLARYVVPQTGPGPMGLPPASAAAAATVSLSILTEGADRVEIIDPLGRRMLRDARSDEDLAEIPDAAIMDERSEHDNDADSDDALTGHIIDIGEALDGHYTIRLYADSGYAVTCSAYDEIDNLSTDAAGDTTVGTVGRSYDLHYSSAARTATLSFIEPLGVEPPSVRPWASRLVVLGNPAIGPVRFAIPGGVRGAEVIEVFDPLGRRVCEIRVGSAQAGASWDWRETGRRSGLYLARLRGSSDAVRFVVFR